MALFGEKVNYESIVAEKLKMNPIADLFSELVSVATNKAEGNTEIRKWLNVDTVKQNSWIGKVEGYYDSRWRTVTIGADFIVIHKCRYWKLRNEEKENVPNLGIRYTNIGYTPIPAYKDSSGKTRVPQQKVIALWGEIIRKRLQFELEGAECNEVENVCDYSQTGRKKETVEAVYFEYQLPELNWNVWF